MTSKTLDETTIEARVRYAISKHWRHVAVPGEQTVEPSPAFHFEHCAPLCRTECGDYSICSWSLAWSNSIAAACTPAVKCIVVELDSLSNGHADD